MAFPLIAVAIAAIGAAIGVGTGAKGVINQREADRVNKTAQDIADGATRSLNAARKRTGDALADLGKAKINVLNTSISDFIAAFSQLKDIDFQNSTGLDELRKFYLDKAAFSELKELSNMASSLAGGAASGATIGAITAFGAFKAAVFLGAASTGTAISTLSGVAATNATLAFFGGGSLAAGGLGVAGGTAVLGGLVAGPALAVLGIVVCARSSGNKDKAYTNLAEARKFYEEMKTASEMCDKIATRANMFRNALNTMNEMFIPLVEKLEYSIDTYGTSYQNFSKAAKENVAAACALVQSIKALIDTPILTPDGKLTTESEEAIREAEESIYG